MALIEVCNGIFRDTDDLEQAEYHYFRKAEALGRREVAKRILSGYLTAKDIDTDTMYEWLRTPDE
jgi:hypothetical protein